MNSFSVKQKVKRAIELSKQFKVTATPMIFVDGKYIIEAKGSRLKDAKVVDHVIEFKNQFLRAKNKNYEKTYPYIFVPLQLYLFFNGKKYDELLVQDSALPLLFA